MEPGRPVGGSYYVFKTLRQLEADGMLARLLSAAQEVGGPGRDEPGSGLPDARRAHARRDRGGGPPETGRRPGGQGRRQGAQAPFARGRRFHAPRQRRTGRPATHRPTLGTQAGSAPGAQTTPPRRRAPGFPCHDAAISFLRWRTRRPAVQGPPPLQTRALGAGRHFRLGRRLRPVHPPACLRSVVAVLAHPGVGVHRRYRRGNRPVEGRRRHIRSCELA